MPTIFNEEAAELIGIFLGDGSIYEKNGQYSVAIFGNSEVDKDYMNNFVSNLMEKVFGVKPSLLYHATRKGMRLQIGRKSAVKEIKKLGLKAGNKNKNDLGIPNWIFEDERFLKSCIRGLIDTDGCVYAKWANKRIPQIEFYSTIPRLRKDFLRAMNILGIKTSKWRWKPNHSCPACGIYGKNEVFKYSKEISFNNPKNIKRLQNILNARVV